MYPTHLGWCPPAPFNPYGWDPRLHHLPAGSPNNPMMGNDYSPFALQYYQQQRMQMHVEKMNSVPAALLHLQQQRAGWAENRPGRTPCRENWWAEAGHSIAWVDSPREDDLEGGAVEAEAAYPTSQHEPDTDAAGTTTDYRTYDANGANYHNPTGVARATPTSPAPVPQQLRLQLQQQQQQQQQLQQQQQQQQRQSREPGSGWASATPKPPVPTPQTVTPMSLHGGHPHSPAGPTTHPAARGAPTLALRPGSGVVAHGAMAARAHRPAATHTNEEALDHDEGSSSSSGSSGSCYSSSSDEDEEEDANEGCAGRRRSRAHRPSCFREESRVDMGTLFVPEGMTPGAGDGDEDDGEPEGAHSVSVAPDSLVYSQNYYASFKVQSPANATRGASAGVRQQSSPRHLQRPQPQQGEQARRSSSRAGKGAGHHHREGGHRRPAPRGEDPEPGGADCEFEPLDPPFLRPRRSGESTRAVPAAAHRPSTALVKGEPPSTVCPTPPQAQTQERGRQGSSGRGRGRAGAAERSQPSVFSTSLPTSIEAGLATPEARRRSGALGRGGGTGRQQSASGGSAHSRREEADTPASATDSSTESSSDSSEGAQSHSSDSDDRDTSRSAVTDSRSIPTMENSAFVGGSITHLHEHSLTTSYSVFRTRRDVAPGAGHAPRAGGGQGVPAARPPHPPGVDRRRSDARGYEYSLLLSAPPLPPPQQQQQGGREAASTLAGKTGRRSLVMRIGGSRSSPSGEGGGSRTTARAPTHTHAQAHTPSISFDTPGDYVWEGGRAVTHATHAAHAGANTSEPHPTRPTAGATPASTPGTGTAGRAPPAEARPPANASGPPPAEQPTTSAGAGGGSGGGGPAGVLPRMPPTPAAAPGRRDAPIPPTATPAPNASTRKEGGAPARGGRPADAPRPPPPDPPAAATRGGAGPKAPAPSVARPSPSPSTGGTSAPSPTTSSTPTLTPTPTPTPTPTATAAATVSNPLSATRAAAGRGAGGGTSAAVARSQPSAQPPAAAGQGGRGSGEKGSGRPTEGAPAPSTGTAAAAAGPQPTTSRSRRPTLLPTFTPSTIPKAAPEAEREGLPGGGRSGARTTPVGGTPVTAMARQGGAGGVGAAQDTLSASTSASRREGHSLSLFASRPPAHARGTHGPTTTAKSPDGGASTRVVSTAASAGTGHVQSSSSSSSSPAAGPAPRAGKGAMRGVGASLPLPSPGTSGPTAAHRGEDWEPQDFFEYTFDDVEAVSAREGGHGSSAPAPAGGEAGGQRRLSKGSALPAAPQRRSLDTTASLTTREVDSIYGFGICSEEAVKKAGAGEAPRSTGVDGGGDGKGMKAAATPVAHPHSSSSEAGVTDENVGASGGRGQPPPLTSPKPAAAQVVDAGHGSARTSHCQSRSGSSADVRGPSSPGVMIGIYDDSDFMELIYQ